MANTSQSHEDYQRERWAQEQMDTSAEQTAELIRIGVADHLIDYNRRYHTGGNPGTPLVDLETLRLGLVLNGMPEIRGWWDPVESEPGAEVLNQSINQRVEWRWTLTGRSEDGYFVGQQEVENKLTAEQSEELDRMFKDNPDWSSS